MPLKENSPENPTGEKCATPTITYANGRVAFTCETEDVEFVSEVTDANQGKRYSSDFTLTPNAYLISVYAIKAGYEKSDVATKTIILQSINDDIDGDGRLTVSDVTSLINKYLENEAK